MVLFHGSCLLTCINYHAIFKGLAGTVVVHLLVLIVFAAPATPAKGEGLMLETFGSEKLLRRDVHHAQLNNNKEATVKVNRNNGWRPMSNEGKIKRGKKPTTDVPLEDKVPFSILLFFFGHLHYLGDSIA